MTTASRLTNRVVRLPGPGYSHPRTGLVSTNFIMRKSTKDAEGSPEHIFSQDVSSPLKKCSMINDVSSLEAI